MYDEKDLQKLIADVTTEFTAHLAKAEKTFSLAKNDDEQPKDKKINGSADDAKNSAKDEKESAKENKDGGRSEDNRNSAKDEKQENGDAKKEASKDESGKSIEGESKSDEGVKDQHQQQDGAKEGQADEDHGYDDEDMQHMHSMYSSMSKGELKAHHDAVRKCMDGMQKMGMSEEMAKSEKDAVISVDNTQEVSLLKSENENLKKNLDAVSAFLAKFVEKTAPAGKAITSLDIIAKNSDAGEKPLQKSEIDAKLLAKSKGDLSQSDRDAINSYYFSKNIETVKHLLK